MTTEQSDARPCCALPEFFNRQALNEVLHDPHYTPERLIGFLSLRYAAELQADAGVREGYTIGEHTSMALGQFEKYGKSTTFSPPMSSHLFRVMIGLHDIGKPEAIRQGNKWLQSRYTVPMLDEALRLLDYSERERKYAVAVVANDFVGNSIKRTRGGDIDGIRDNAYGIVRMAGMVGVSPQAFLDVATLFFAVDVSSYTEDAGGSYDYPASGKPSLAFLFDFDTELQAFRFAPAIEAIRLALEESVQAYHHMTARPL